MTNEEEWIEIYITPSMLEEANANVRRYNDFNLFGGAYAQKLSGEVGRLALRKFLNENEVAYREDRHIGSKDEFDFIILGKNVSLKTQLVNYFPIPRWRCEVNELQLDNPCDFYLFAKAYLRQNKVWLVGCISKERFDEEGILRSRGEMLNDNVTTWEVRETKKDVKIEQLDPIRNLISE